MAPPLIVDPFEQVHEAATQPSFVDVFAPGYEPPKGAFRRGVNTAVRGFAGSAAGTGALAADVANAPDARRAALAVTHEQGAAAARDTMRVEDIKDFESGADYLKYALGYLATQFGITATSALGGRLLGGLGASAVGAAASKVAAQQAGTVAGLAGSSLMQEIGQIYPEALEQGVADPVQRALVGGAIAAAADFVPEAYVARRAGLLGKSGRSSSVTGEAGKVAGLEAATELFQTYVERAAAGQPTTGEEANSDYLNAGVLGALGGGIAGGVAGAYNRARTTVDGSSEASPPVQDTPAYSEPVQPAPAVQAPAPPSDTRTPFQQYDATGPGNEPTTTGALSIVEGDPIPDTVPALASLPFKTTTPAGSVLGGTAPASAGEIIAPPREGFQRTAEDLIRDRARASATPALEVAAGPFSSRTTTADQRLNAPLPEVRREDIPKKRLAGEGVVIGQQPAAPTLAELIVPESAAAKPAFARTAEEIVAARKAPAPAIEVAGGSLSQRTQTAEERATVAPAQGTLRFDSKAATATPEFQRFFADSKVVDTKGEPLRVFHGSRGFKGTRFTNQDRTVLDKALGKEKAGAFFFADDASVAEDHAAAGEVIPAYLSIKNPKTLDYSKGFTSTAVKQALAEGHDGLILENYGRGGKKSTAYVAFDSKQIKSAVGNNGQFDPNNPDILQSRGGVAKGLDLIANERRPVDVTAPAVNSSEILARHFAVAGQEGSTSNLVTGANLAGTPTYAVSPYKERQVVIPGRHPNPEEIDAYVAANEDLLLREDHALGTWFNHEDNSTYLDVVVALPEFDRALRVGLENKQLAIFNLETFTEIPVDAEYAARGEAAIRELEKILGVPENLAVKSYISDGGAGAIHLGPLKDLIELNLNARDVLSVAHHEGFHYLEHRVLPAGELAAVQRAFAPGTDLHKRLLERVAAYDAANGTNLAEEVRSVPAEARAYAFEFWKRGELKVDGIVKRAFAAIKRAIERIVNAVRGHGFTSYEDVFRAIDRGYYAKRYGGSALKFTTDEDPYIADIEPDAIPGETLARDGAASVARGRPYWVNSAGDVRNLRTRLRLLALEGERARDWHARSGEAVLAWAGGDKARAAKLAALIANYSPRTPVGLDLVKAMTHLQQWEEQRPIRVGAPTQHIKSANEILAGTGGRDANDNVQPTGIKRQNFFRNLMLGIDPVRYNAGMQGATIDMWMAHAFNYANDAAGSVTKSQYNYADAEIKRLARELGWQTEETQAAIWVAIKSRGDTVRSLMEKHAEKNGWYDYTLKKEKPGTVPDLFGQSEGKYQRVVKAEFQRAFVTQWMNFALQSKPTEEAFQRANYSYKEAFEDLAAGRLRGGDFVDLTPFALEEDSEQDGYEGQQSLTLFSRAAVNELAGRAANGEIPRAQLNARLAELLDNKDIAGDFRERLFERAGDEFAGTVGGVKRAYLTNISSGENLARHSRGYKNVFNALTTFTQRKNRLIADGVEKKLSSWVKGASEGDKATVSKALLDRTVGGYEAGSPQYDAIVARLNTRQREMFKQATEMIADRLDAEFRADVASYSRALGPDTEQFREWYADRRAQVDELKRTGYFPERRYGDHAVHAYVEGANGKRVTLYYSQHQREADARAEQAEITRVLGDAPGVKLEYGYRYRADYDGTISFQQFLDMANRHGVALTQTEKERLAKALVAADSVRRNRIFRRKNVAGYSQDGMRVLAEFGVSMANKIAYHELGTAVNDAIAGKEVSTRFTPTGEVAVDTQHNTNLWAEDGPMGGYYRNLADRTADFVMGAKDGSKWSRGLRAAATVQFLGGSIAAGMVQLTSMAMNVTPWLTQYTGYTDALARSFDGYKLAMSNHKALTDLPTLLNDAVRIEGVDTVEGLREALKIAAQDGTTLDTEIYQIMGLSRGQEFSFSGNTQKAIRAWMTPFRITEQWNRTGTFIAAFKLAKDQKKSDGDAYKFAQETVYSTQFRYDEANRPALARGDVGSLLFVFKSYPIFMLETMTHLAKVAPGSAATMLLTLTLAAGIEGLPFAEDLEDVVDTIAQRVFGSPFNTKRALRNTFKAASEAVVGTDLSSVLMHGLVNEFTGLSFASRVGLGNLIPGTRFVAADADYKRVMSEILGPVGTFVTGALGGVDALSRGQFMEAARQALPLAGQNFVKGVDQWNKGFATDIGGRKLIDVSGPEAFWQSIGFSSSALTHAYESDRIDKQTVAFYRQARESFMKDLTRAIREGDSDGARRVTETIVAWNASHPEMPMVLSPEGLRRHIQLAGLPMNQRTFQTMPRALRGTSEYVLGLEDR